MEALWALYKYDQQANVAIPAIIDHLKDPDEHVRDAAVNSLGKIGAGSAQAAEAMTDFLQKECIDGPTPGCTKMAAEALGSIGPVAKAAIPALERLRQSDDKQTRQTAIIAIRRIQASK